MGYRQMLKQIALQVPGLRTYVQARSFSRQVVDLRETVSQLETRNAAWEAEVRELRGAPKSQKIIWPVATSDILAAQWDKPRTQPALQPKQPPYAISWVMPPMGPVSGGHADIFRTIHFLESQGHTCKIYFYDPRQESSLPKIKELLLGYPSVQAKLFYNAKEIGPCDALFATHWTSAYPVFNAKVSAKKFYFVQDFEPFFDPVGSYSTLTENTYRFGFYGITLGSWLQQKLSREYGMKCDAIELGVDTNEYRLTNTKPRTKIFFYARPVTPRRGFELGVLALAQFHKQHPEAEIHFVGWDITPYEIPFPYVNRGILSSEELNELYNQCAAGLVLSFTNMSLLPLEMLAAGCVPVVNDAEHTRMAPYAKDMRLVPPTPLRLAEALHDLLVTKQPDKQAKAAAAAAKKHRWDASHKRVEAVLHRELSGKKA